MTKFFTILLLANCFLDAAGQTNVKSYTPKEILQVDLSIKTQKELERQYQLLAKENRSEEEQKELDTLLEKYGEVIESVWNIMASECSWYCGGGNYDIKASSSLPDTAELKYAAINANDLSYKTAWVAGRNKGGIGEYLEYYFKNKSPRITKIIISNGYMKSEEAWKNNNRVKKLKLFVNGKVHGILNLEDSKTDQVFEAGTLGHNKNGKDLILRFEIIEVYKGDKFNDTAITEIYFDGIDVH
jgi:hypothetical protein